MAKGLNQTDLPISVSLKIRGDITFSEDVDATSADLGAAHPVVEAPKFVSLGRRDPRTCASLGLERKREVKEEVEEEEEEQPRKKHKKKKIKKEKA